MAPNETTSNKLLIGVNLRYQISALRSLANNQVSRLMLNRPTAYSTLGLNLLILRICCVTLSGLLIYRVQFRSVNWASPRPLVSGRLIWQDDD